MLRLLGFIIVVAVLVAGAVWLADRPGEVVVEWQGWRVATTVPILFLAVAILAAVPIVLARALGFVGGAPARIALRRRALRKERGYQALVDGLAAAAAGQGKEARKHADRAHKYLADPALTSVLASQAAQMTGDPKGAHSHNVALLERPETAALGLRGLLREAIESGDHMSAIDFAQRARKLSPADAWLAETLFGLLVKARRLREAEELVVDAIKRKAMPEAQAKRRRAIVAHERARAAEAEGRAADAHEHAQRAAKLDPTLAAASANAARLHGAAGNLRRAQKLLAEAWRHSPAPELIAAAKSLGEKLEPLEHLRMLEKLTEGNREHPETHRVLGEAALEAKLWGEARRHLLAAAEAHPAQSVYRALARLEETQFGNHEAARAWLDKAASAPPDPGWACTKCGTPAKDWSLECPSCGGIDTLAWVAPRVGGKKEAASS